MITRQLLAQASTANIRRLAASLEVKRAARMPRRDLIDAVLRELAVRAHGDYLMNPTSAKREAWINAAIAANS